MVLRPDPDMKQLAIAAYAARSILRRRLATAPALVGVLLAVAVATAPWVALDSALRGLAKFYFEGDPVDVEASGPEGPLLDAAIAAAAVPNVVQVEPSVFFTALELNLSGTFYRAQSLWIFPTFASSLGRLGIHWTAPPAPGGIVVHDSFRQRGIGTGDRVSVELRTPQYDANYTIIGYKSRPSVRTVTGFYNTSFNLTSAFGFLFFPMVDLNQAKVEFNETGPWTGELLMWLDHSALFNPYDPDGSLARWQRVRTLLETALIPRQFYLGFGATFGGTGLIGPLEQFASHVRLLRIWFLPFTIPTIALAVLLSRVGFDIGLHGRRREIAVMRARGVSNRGVRAFLFVEMSMISLLAALCGLGLAFLLSRLFVTLPMFAVQRYREAPYVPAAEIAVSPITVALAIGFAWLLAWIASRRAVQLALSRDLISSFRAYHVEEVSVPHRASRDFLLVMIAAAGLLLLISSAFIGAGSDMATLLGLPTVFLGSVAPFLLAIGLGRYLTRGTTRAYRALARLFRGLLGDLGSLVDKNIARAPRRASNIAMIVTFAVAFLVAISAISASSEAYLDEQTHREVPSDIIVEGLSFPTQYDLSGLATVRAISGIAELTPIVVSSLGADVIIIFDATTYLRTVPWLESRHLGGTDPQLLMETLAQGDSLAVNRKFQASTGLLIGDPVSISLSSPDRKTFSFTRKIAAAVPFLPGLDVSPVFLQRYLDFSALPVGRENDVAGSLSLLIALKAGADTDAVVKALADRLGESAFIRTFAEALRLELGNPARAGTFAYLGTQSQVAAILLVIGIGLLVYSAASSRRNELVTLVARGLPRNKVARLIMAEGWIVALLGILLGTFTGLLATASLLAVVSTVLPFPMALVVPWTALLPVIVVTAGVWTASFLGAVSIQRMDVARVLKLRGG